MRKQSQSSNTVISTIRDHVQAWRKQQGWSRESVVDEIVKAHKRLDGPMHTGISFEPHTIDTFERMKVNADRVYRWLDDVSKDINYLPSNFIPSILAAMPPAIRIKTVNDILLPLGMTASHLNNSQETITFSIQIMQNMIKEDAEAHSAYADLLDGSTREELVIAQRELSEAIAEKQRVLEQIERELVG